MLIAGLRILAIALLAVAIEIIYPIWQDKTWGTLKSWRLYTSTFFIIAALQCAVTIGRHGG